MYHSRNVLFVSILDDSKISYWFIGLEITLILAKEINSSLLYGGKLNTWNLNIIA